MSGKGLSLRTDLMIQEYQESMPATGAHLWDSRLKLGLLIAAVAANVVVAELWLSSALFLTAVCLIIWSRIPAYLFLLFFLAPAWATFLVFVGFSIGFGSTPVGELGPVTVYREGIALGLSAAARVASDMSWMALVFLTTPFSRLLTALKWFRVPDVLVDALSMAYRYAFLLFDEFYRMAASARIKGGFRSRYGRLESTGMILSQVLLRAYDRATAIQEAMVSRGASAELSESAATSDPESVNSAESEAAPDDALAPITSTDSAPVLETRHAAFSYIRGGAHEIDDLSFKVGKGEIVFLCGSNGSGKSTLLKLVAGILKPLDGEIYLSGVRLDKHVRNQAFRYVGLLFQDPDDQVFCPTVREDVAFGPRNMGLAPEEVDRVVSMAMELTEIDHLADRPIHRLSYGEMKRIGLAGLLAMRPPLLLLDEPRAYLDPAAAERFVGLVKRLNRELGYTFVIVTHDMDFAAQLASRVVVLDHGRIAADDSPRRILTDQTLLARSRLQPPLLTRVFSSLEGGGPAIEDIPLTAAEATALLSAGRHDGD